MAETYNSLIEGAKRRLNESLASAAADAVVIAERFGKPLRGVVTDITSDWPETHRAVYERAKRQKARSGADSGGSISEPTESHKGAIRGSKSAIRNYPELASEMVSDPEVRNTLRQALVDHDNRAVAAASERDDRDPISSTLKKKRAVQELQTVLARHADAVEALVPQLGELSIADAPWLETALGRSESANEQVRYFLDHGETAIDAGLKELVGEA